jgi:hypothetical protein
MKLERQHWYELSYYDCYQSRGRPRKAFHLSNYLIEPKSLSAFIVHCRYIVDDISYGAMLRKVVHLDPNEYVVLWEHSKQKKTNLFLM